MLKIIQEMYLEKITKFYNSPTYIMDTSGDDGHMLIVRSIANELKVPIHYVEYAIGN